MPHIPMAGTVSSPPKSNPFPDQGRPFASVTIDADDVSYHVVAHDVIMAELESLQVGDRLVSNARLCFPAKKANWPGFTSLQNRCIPLDRDRGTVQMARDAYL
jgi:hypothetical protein